MKETIINFYSYGNENTKVTENGNENGDKR